MVYLEQAWPCVTKMPWLHKARRDGHKRGTVVCTTTSQTEHRLLPGFFLFSASHAKRGSPEDAGVDGVLPTHPSRADHTQ